MLLHAAEAYCAIDQAGGQQQAKHGQGTNMQHTLHCHSSADICFALQRKLNANQHCTSRLVLQVYPECCEIEKHIQKVTLPEQVKKDVAHIFRERWNSMHSKLHSVGYMLEPQVQGTDFSVEVRLLLPE